MPPTARFTATFLLALTGIATAVAAFLACLGTTSLWQTPVLGTSDTGTRGTVTGPSLPTVTGPDGTIGAIRISRCAPFERDICTPHPLATVPFGGPLQIDTGGQVLQVDAGDPFTHWRGAYNRNSLVVQDATDLPPELWDAIPHDVELAWQVQVLSVSEGDEVHVYGTGDDLRVVVGEMASPEAAVDRQRLKSAMVVGGSLATALLMVLSAVQFAVAAWLVRRR